MKTTSIITFGFASILVLMSACTSSLDQAINPANSVPFTLSVSVDNHIPTGGGAATRAASNAYPVTFSKGDRLGLIAIDVNNNIVTNYNNIPFTYTDGKWVPTTTVAFSTAYKYLVYYPYQETMINKKTKDEIIAATVPLADQHSEAAHKLSDLLVCAIITPNSTDQTLSVNFEHAFSLLVIPVAQATITFDETDYQCGLSATDPSITLGTQVCLPYIALDGSVRLVVKPQTCVVKGYFSFGSKLYSSSSDEITLSENHCYLFKDLAVRIGYGFNNTQLGDYYCKNADGAAYLMPNNAILTETLKNTCLGIVYWVGNIAKDDALLGGKLTAGTHGLVVSLHEAKASVWSVLRESVHDWVSIDDRYKNLVNITEKDKMCGYGNTLALGAYNKSGNVRSRKDLAVLPIESIDAYTILYPAPTSSSGWYCPSSKELKSMCWGQGHNQRTANREMLDKQLVKVDGASFGNNIYLSSTEADAEDALYVNFSNGNEDKINKSKAAYRVRPFLAF